MLRFLVLLYLCLALPTQAQVGPFEEMKSFPHSQLYSERVLEDAEYLLGLGALQKIGGRWRHKNSERIEGRLEARTWQINEAFTAEEAFEWFQEQLPQQALLLYECQGRSCGSSAQWADRVFAERVLYGHVERQRYAAYRLQRDDGEYTLVLYGSDRANRRHFLRLDILLHKAP